MSLSHYPASEHPSALGDADSDDHPARTQTDELSASSTMRTAADGPISLTHSPRETAMPATHTPMNPALVAESHLGPPIRAWARSAHDKSKSDMCRDDWSRFTESLSAEQSSTFKNFLSAIGYGDLPDGERRAVEDLYDMYVSSANEDAPGEATKAPKGADDGKDRVGTDRREAEASVNSYPSDDSDDSGDYIILAEGELDCWGTQPPSKQEGQASAGEGAMTPDCALGGMYGTVKPPAGSVSGSDYGLIRIDAESPSKIISKVKGPTNVYDVLALLEAERERIRHSEGTHLLPDDHEPSSVGTEPQNPAVDSAMTP